MQSADDAGIAAQEPMAIDLNLELFEKVAKDNGWTSSAQIATALGISERQVSRVRSGKGRPGISFVAGLWAAAGEDFRIRQMYRVVPESAPIGKD